MKDSLIPKVSVVIPVWNPGPGISRCIESLRKQTLIDIEMIFVDDCGTDDSMDKVRAAAKEDSRICIIENEKNIGAGPSRNKGIDAARGEYLSFVDADDYIALDFLELLYEEACQQSFDIVKGTRILQAEDGTIIDRDNKLNQRIQSGNASGKPLYLLFTFEHQSAIYRREFIKNKHIWYGNYSRAQDVTFLLRACSQANSFSLVNDACYYFCSRPNSSMHTLDRCRLQGYLQSVQERSDYVLNNLTGEDGAGEYLQMQFLNAIREADRYRELSGMDEALKEYAADLRSEWIRMPCYEELSNQYYALKALYCHCVMLPNTAFSYHWETRNPPIGYAKLAEQWVDYYLYNPGERKACTKDLMLLLTRANMAVHGKPVSSFSKQDIAIGRKIYKKQISRLPLKIRWMIPINGLSAKAFLHLPSSVKELLKEVIKRL